MAYLTDAEIDKLSLAEVNKYIDQYAKELNRRLNELEKLETMAQEEIQIGLSYMRGQASKANINFDNFRADGKAYRFDAESSSELAAARARLKLMSQTLQSAKTTMAGLNKLHMERVDKIMEELRGMGVDVDDLTPEERETLYEILKHTNFAEQGYESEEVIGAFLASEAMRSATAAEVRDFINTHYNNDRHVPLDVQFEYYLEAGF